MSHIHKFLVAIEIFVDESCFLFYKKHVLYHVYSIKVLIICMSVQKYAVIEKYAI
jgi:hypothetical protein